jgi:hypothetical protein
VNRLRAHLGPLWPYAVLIAIPAAAFILPDVFGGHLLMSGDNVQQNYPLHVLTGTMLRHGQLPLWDPYIFSGTPLLAGFNAGSFYPLVGFFVILPDRAAWIATEVVLFAGIATGMYAFLRALTLSTLACLLGAITFAFSGTVLSQVNHVDMTEGFVALPFMLLAVLHIIRDGRWRWAVLLGAGFALVILGGAPEAMLDVTILVMLYALLTAGFDRSRLWRIVTRGAAGAALGLSLAAIQWLPGLSAIASSQRGALGAGFATDGSFPPADGLLALVPYLYGGFGHLGEKMFFSSYNLPEVGIYLGILPIVALLVMWIPSWPTRLPPRERLTWYLIGVVGVLLALGGNTPLEHVFNLVPLYGHQRLQSRNMIDFSAVVSVLFAGWIDREKEPSGTWLRTDRLTALLPLAMVLAVLGLAIADPKLLINSLTSGDPTPLAVHTVRESTIIAAGVCALAASVVWLRSIMPARGWIPIMTLFVIADIGFIAATSQLATPPENGVISGTTAVDHYIAANLAPGGRFVVYDPQNYSEAPRGATALADYNILAGIPSASGYSSIVNETYNKGTQLRTVGELEVPSLESGALDDLDIQDVLTIPEYFLLPLLADPSSLAGVQQTSEDVGQDPVLPFGTRTNFVDKYYPFYPAPRASIAAGHMNKWFFGETLSPDRASLVFSGPATRAKVRFGTTAADGSPTWGAPVVVKAGALSVSSGLPAGSSSGLAVQVLSGRLPSHQAVVMVGQHAFEIDGALSAAIQPGVWHQKGSVAGHTLLIRDSPPSPLRVIAAGSPRDPRVAVLSDQANVETIRVQVANPSVVVRSVAWDKGWGATVSVNGGPARASPVTAYGLVQQVHLPAGRDVVTFRYRPVHFVVSCILSGAAALLLIALAIVSLVRIRRRKIRSTATS